MDDKDPPSAGAAEGSYTGSLCTNWRLPCCGKSRLTGDESDHEEVTDLLTVYLGFGVFTANSRVRDRSTHAGTTEEWSIRRLG